MKRVLIAFLFVFFLKAIAFSQEPINDPYQEPVFIQTSPEVSAFKRYGEIPVSLYTGVPDISIPLHSVKFKNMEVPISLSYHAGGITVDQEATIVGLGWNLMAGGNITVSAVGARETPIVGIEWEGWQKNLDFIAANTGGIVNVGSESPYNTWGCAFNGCGPAGFAPDFLQGYGIAANMGMGELDLYKVNLPNRSFTFIIHPSTLEPILVGEKNKCMIELNDITSVKWEFVITDEQGIKYYFSVAEYDNYDNMPNAWHMTRIVDVYGNEIVFDYQSLNIGTLPKMSESVRGLYPSSQPVNRSFSYPGDVSNYYLKAIKTKTQRVSFQYEGGRRDFAGSKLKYISVIDSLDQSVKTLYKFNYGYFNSSNVGGDYIKDEQGDAPLPTDAKTLRLKLESLFSIESCK
ncbi:hypothetical protein [Reichenbachiella ulvae]|uniref:YD repeat-containing protein n=1 Tax=Reichenbachiella ulvae TaxID=2980104 RepID=A0ABT3CUV1_9BACT|nr:hypothetical protein [Reichenbachiella ulvae]MCV9387477.1 hypothetical protein [Reichenbachiella ulvae]